MKIKCKVCGNEFNPIVERHYISRDGGKIGVIDALVSKPEEKLYDTFDCPECGCQVVVQERKRAYVNVANTFEDDENCKED